MCVTCEAMSDTDFVCVLSVRLTLVLMKELVISVKETQQSQDFMATQAAADQLQAQLTQQQQACEAAAKDEQAKEQAHKYR